MICWWSRCAFLIGLLWLGRRMEDLTVEKLDLETNIPSNLINNFMELLEIDIDCLKHLMYNRQESLAPSFVTSLFHRHQPFMINGAVHDGSHLHLADAFMQSNLHLSITVLQGQSLSKLGLSAQQQQLRFEPTIVRLLACYSSCVPLLLGQCLSSRWQNIHVPKGANDNLLKTLLELNLVLAFIKLNRFLCG